MKKIIVALLAVGLVLALGYQNSFANVLTSLDQLNFQTKTVAWDADTNTNIRLGTKNIGVALLITNNSPYTIYLAVQKASPITGTYPSISLQNNICKTLTNGGKVCTSYGDSFNLKNSFFGRAGVILQTLQPFSSFKLNLGSFPLSSAKTYLPLDVATTMSYAVYADQNYIDLIYDFVSNSNDPVFIPEIGNSNNTVFIPEIRK